MQPSESNLLLVVYSLSRSGSARPLHLSAGKRNALSWIFLDQGRLSSIVLFTLIAKYIYALYEYRELICRASSARSAYQLVRLKSLSLRPAVGLIIMIELNNYIELKEHFILTQALIPSADSAATHIRCFSRVPAVANVV